MVRQVAGPGFERNFMGLLGTKCGEYNSSAEIHALRKKGVDTCAGSFGYLAGRQIIGPLPGYTPFFLPGKSGGPD